LHNDVYNALALGKTTFIGNSTTVTTTDTSNAALLLRLLLTLPLLQPLQVLLLIIDPVTAAL